MPRKKANSRKLGREKKSKGTFSRRDVLKIGAAAGAVTVIAPTMLTSRKAFAFDEPPTEPVICATNPTNSPPHTPFADTFTAPFPAIPQDLDPAPTKERNEAGGEALRVDHQRWEEFLPDVEYELEARLQPILSTLTIRRPTFGASTASTQRRRF